MKIKVGCAMGTCTLEDIIEFSDDCTEEEIEDVVHEFVNGFFEWWYEKEDE